MNFSNTVLLPSRFQITIKKRKRNILYNKEALALRCICVTIFIQFHWCKKSWGNHVKKTDAWKSVTKPLLCVQG